MEKGTKVTTKSSAEHKFVYLLGGPGSGKGTQCPKIAERFGFCHLSVDMIKPFKLEGKLLPSERVIKILQPAVEERPITKFLIDGFPCNLENRVAAVKIMKIDPEFVLYLDCSEEVMINRVLKRNQGRADDNMETMAKRINVFLESTLPVIDYYSSKQKVFKVNADQSPENVFNDIETLFLPLEMQEFD